ncbi:membrane associated ring-CH-type finger 4 [Coregonus clupeaformis]|uniref:membrane associated ring-CH-type finger 4 n=1 Tax=Coregonus clupeaformis TaxID=59861 RepID=UPI001BDFFCB5|nr:membrane associated ring-CH-type finger 4 [Coregonus clupeaformis]
MLRGLDMLKNRCCVLFGDLKVLLLRPPAPVTIPIPMTGHIPDSRETGVPSDVSIPDNDTLRAHQGPGDKWTAPAPGGASGLERDRPGWVDATAAEPSGILHCSSSSKDRLEQRFSLCSYGDSGGIRSPVCRICFQGPETGELLSPCRCSGSVRCTHQPCLIKWISERGSWACELCYYKYQVITISTNNPLQWQSISLTGIEKVQIAAAVLGSMFLVASLSWLVWSSFSPSARWQRHDLLFQICYGMYGFMDIVCFALIIHEGPSVFRIFNRWQAVNQQWKVLNYDKTTDREDLKRAATVRTLSQPRSGQRNQPGTESQPRSGQRNQPGRELGRSSSTSPLAAATTAPDLYTASPAPGIGLVPHGSTEQASETAGPDQHCAAYNILQLLSHLRQPEAHGHPSHSTRELVMRVTTV